MSDATPRARGLAFVGGVLAGALVLGVMPSTWLFREPQTRGATPGATRERYACPMFCTMAGEPGTCPVCGMEMELVVDQGERVPLNAHERYMAGIRTAPVARRLAEHRVRALGRIAHDERREARVTAWVAGRIDALHVDFTGTTVAVGERVAMLYAPELLAAQEELLTAHRALRAAKEAQGPRAAERLADARTLHAAVRRRLALLGMPEATLDEIERADVAHDHVEVLSAAEGTVVRKWVQAGDYVRTGDPLLTVVDLGKVWALLEVFEEDAGAVRVGQAVEVRVPGLPGDLWEGRVAFVDPMLDPQRRILRVRVDLENPHGRLRPGLFAEAHVRVELTADGRVHDPAPAAGAPVTTPGPVRLVPRSAILEGGGGRAIAFVMTQAPGSAGPDGVERWPAIYEPREVRTGHRVGSEVVVLSGLEEGEFVVLRGQFLLDSQLQLTGKPSLMIPEAAGARAEADPHAGH